MTDNIFEIETTALGACCVLPAGIRHPIDGLCCCLSQRQPYLDPLCDRRRLNYLRFIRRFLRNIYSDSITHVEFAGTDPEDNSLWQGGVRQGMSSEWFSFCNGLRP